MKPESAPDPDTLPFSDEMIDEWKKTNRAIIEAWFALDEVATPATSGCGDSLQVREQSSVTEEKIAEETGHAYLDTNGTETLIEEVVAGDSGYYSMGSGLVSFRAMLAGVEDAEIDIDVETRTFHVTLPPARSDCPGVLQGIFGWTRTHLFTVVTV